MSLEAYQRLRPQAPQRREIGATCRLDRQAGAALVPAKRQGFLVECVEVSLADLCEQLGPTLLTRFLG
jgi:hypothetical protein